MEKKTFFSTKRITGIAVLTALVIVLQTVLGAIRIGATSFSLVLIPIVLGGVIYGAWTGAFLGFVFGFITLMYGVVGADTFTAILFQNQPLETALLCLVKGTAAGFVSGMVYKAFSNKNELVAIFLAAAAAPIINTGLFIGGSLLFLQKTLLVNFVESGSTVVYFLFIGCAGVNFLVELAVNLVAAPTLHRIIRILEKGKRK
jgi:uncharacterized membrane protein